jgi:hypothetical protein
MMEVSRRREKSPVASRRTHLIRTSLAHPTEGRLQLISLPGSYVIACQTQSRYFLSYRPTLHLISNMNFIATRVFTRRGTWGIRHGGTTGGFPLRLPLRTHCPSDIQYPRTITRRRNHRRVIIHNSFARWASSQMDHHRYAEDHRSYRRVIRNILSGKKFRTIQSSLESQGIWNKDEYDMFRNWLLTNDSVMDNDISTWKKVWSSDPRYKFGNLLSDTHPSSFREMLHLRQKKFRTQMMTMASNSTTQLAEFPPSFFPMIQIVFQELFSQCIAERNSKVARPHGKRLKNAELYSTKHAPCHY